MSNLKYIAYVRKSTEDEERQVLSRAAQRDKINEIFGELTIIDYLDESKSAFEPGKRPIFDQVLAKLDSGEADGIIAWHPDRLSRNAIDAAAISHRISKGTIKDLKFASFSFDNSPEGIMMLQMTMSQSQYFSAKLSKDIRRGNEKKRQLGGLTGKAMEGYLNDRMNKTTIIDPARFPLIRKAFDLYLTGEYSVQAILRILNDEWGYTTLKRKRTGGGPLSRTSLYNIFRNVRYAGLVPDPYDPEKLYKSEYPAMITLEEYDQVQLLLGRKGLPRLVAKKEFALRGLIRCGECGCSITAQTKKKKMKCGRIKSYTYYHCTGKRPGCSQKSIYVREEQLYKELTILLDKYQLDERLFDWALEAFKDMAAAEVIERNQVQLIQDNKIHDTQRQLDKLLDLATKELITTEEYSLKSEQLKAALNTLQKDQTNTAARTKNWYEFATNTLHTLCDAENRFINGDIAVKKEILLAIGQNPTLLDGKLHITPVKWLNPVADSAEHITKELNKVRTLSLQMQKASEEAVRHQWCRGRDSNPRRHKADRFTVCCV